MCYTCLGNLPPQIHSAVSIRSTLDTSYKQFHAGSSQSGDMAQSTPTTNEILSLEEIEKQALVHALEVTGNNITQAAQALDISRTTIHRKFKKYHLCYTAHNQKLRF